MQPEHSLIYEINIKGPLDPRWQSWFNGLKIDADSNGNTLLIGPIPDQAALHGLLARVRDLGLVLLSLRLLSAPDHKSDGSASQIKK